MNYLMSCANHKQKLLRHKHLVVRAIVLFFFSLHSENEVFICLSNYLLILYIQQGYLEKV